MDDIRHNQRQGLRRYRVTLERTCSFGAIAFKNPQLTDHAARIVDISANGLGIEPEQFIEPGIIWFKESVFGKKHGILVWCKQDGLKFRAGIQFISLTQATEEYLQRQVIKSLPSHALHDPVGIIAKLITSLRSEPGQDHRGRDTIHSPERKSAEGSASFRGWAMALSKNRLTNE